MALIHETLDKPMPLTMAYLRSLPPEELFEFRPRLWALARMALRGDRPWWQTQEQERWGVRISGIGRLLLFLASCHPRQMFQRLSMPKLLDRKM